MKYSYAPDLKAQAQEIVEILKLHHINLEHVECIRSSGSSTRRTFARCHGLGKVMQLGLKREAFYVLEFLTERFDSLSSQDKIKTIIHELMHIPKSFGGGFKHHDYVTSKNVDIMYKEFINRKLDLTITPEAKSGENS